MSAMAAVVHAGHSPNFAALRVQLREFAARHLMASRGSDERILGCTPLAVLGPAPRRVRG
ncbi:hypothetical protein ACIP5Y_09510 [Nocardia sp. NPDC088792]|uniref:hypothetical protein n=1 Tax=Nocardia sp. NPDC088792 TaxID=3364332 RepID=UPI00382B9A44